MGRRPFFYKDFAVLLKSKFPGKMLTFAGVEPLSSSSSPSSKTWISKSGSCNFWIAPFPNVCKLLLIWRCRVRHFSPVLNASLLTLILRLPRFTSKPGESPSRQHKTRQKRKRLEQIFVYSIELKQERKASSKVRSRIRSGGSPNYDVNYIEPFEAPVEVSLRPTMIKRG